MIEISEPDLVLMDIEMPEMNGVEATRLAIEKYPNLKILALSMFGEEDYYFKMIHAGVKGFIMKSASVNELLHGIKTVVDGESFFSNELLRGIINRLSVNKTKPEPSKPADNQITPRELDVLKLLCAGYSTIEIADKLNIGTKTVENNRSRLLSKTGVKNSIGLVMYAFKNKLVELQ